MEGSEQKITTFLMFTGRAEEAMNYYVSIFEHSEIISILRYGEDETGTPGSVMKAQFSLNGQLFMCIDSNVEHEFTFTPAISLYATCDSEEEVDKVFNKLSQDGIILMELGTYPFSKKFAWVQDKFGVSWQLSLN